MPTGTKAEKSRELPVVVLTADTLISLVRRMDALEIRLKEMQSEFEKQFEKLCDHIPLVVPQGLEFLAIGPGDDEYENVIVPRAIVAAQQS